MKTCSECKQDKTLSEFYVHKAMLDGYLNKCKECVKSRIKKHRNENIEKIKEYDKQRANLPHRIQARKQYSQSPKGKEAHAKAHKKYIEKFPMARAAQVIVGNAIRDGRLIVKKICSVCGSNKLVEAHHDDYTKPLDIRELCKKCHKEWHSQNEPIYK
jgi:ribosomal protein S27AE